MAAIVQCTLSPQILVSTFSEDRSATPPVKVAALSARDG